MMRIKNRSKVVSMLLIMALAVTGVVGPAQADEEYPEFSECTAGAIYFSVLVVFLIWIIGDLGRRNESTSEWECVDTSLP